MKRKFDSLAAGLVKVLLIEMGVQVVRIVIMAVFQAVAVVI